MADYSLSAMAGASSAAETVPSGSEARAAQVMASPTVVHSNYVPAQLHRQLEFIDFNRDGQMILGCSDLTGRYWTGSLWYFRDPSEAPLVEKALTGVDCDNGVVDGRFIGDKSKHMLIALDNGAVEHISLTFSDEGEGSVSDQEGDAPNEPSSFFYLERMASVQEHDDIITGLDLTSDGKQLVTSSYDKSVVCLDVNTLRLESRLVDAHSDLITSVSANKINPAVIATSGNDGRVILWDLKTNREQSCVCQTTTEWPTLVEWIPNSEHHLVVGNQIGEISIYDVRQNGKSVATIKALGKQIHQLKFSAKRPHSFSVSGDTNRLRVVDVDDTFTGLTTRIDDGSHDDYVRGMAWHPVKDVLYSCGWDHKVICHEV